MKWIANATVAAAIIAAGPVPMLQPSPAVAQGNYAVEQRFQDQERLITQLTGQVERLQNQIQQLQQQLERVQSDYDYRLQALEGGRGGSRTPPPPGGRPGAPLPPRTETYPPPAPGGLSPGQQTDTRPMGTTPSSGVPPAPAASAEQLYTDARSAMLGGDFAGAERGFHDFLARYPRDQRAANAQYWLGETYYARKDYQNASNAFATGFRTYRNSAVGPDNLLKLGLSLQATGKSSDACIVYGQFGQVYPQAPANLKQRVVEERRRSKCS